MRSVKRLILSRNQLEFDREVKMTLIEGKFLLSYAPYIGENDERVKRFRRFIATSISKGVHCKYVYFTNINEKFRRSLIIAAWGGYYPP